MNFAAEAHLQLLKDQQKIDLVGAGSQANPPAAPPREGKGAGMGKTVDGAKPRSRSPPGGTGKGGGTETPTGSDI